MRRLSAKGVVVLLALVGAGLLLVSAFRPWVTGAVNDAVLGATRISATGSEVAPGLSAVALAIAAAAIAIVAAGRIARVVAVVAYAVCVAVAAVLAVRVLLDPEGVLGPVAASRPSRTRRSGPGSHWSPARWRCSGWSARSSASAAGEGPRSATRWARAAPAWRPGRAANASRATGTRSAPGVTRPMWARTPRPDRIDREPSGHRPPHES